MARDPACLALLRGINVGGRNVVPMAGLREVCEGLGWGEVRTYIQSGNVVFRAPGSRKGGGGAGLESALERGLEERFGLSISVVVRPAAAWARYVEGNPFREASTREPNLVMLCLSKAPPRPDAAEVLRGRAADGERVEVVGDAVWIHVPTGAGRSKLASPAVLDRAVGSAVTARNWRTVVAIGEMAAGV